MIPCVPGPLPVMKVVPSRGRDRRHGGAQDARCAAVDQPLEFRHESFFHERSEDVESCTVEPQDEDFGGKWPAGVVSCALCHEDRSVSYNVDYAPAFGRDRSSVREPGDGICVDTSLQSKLDAAKSADRRFVFARGVYSATGGRCLFLSVKGLVA